MILGINASGRSAVRNGQGILVKGVTEDILIHIFKETGEPHEYVYLGGKTIGGCRRCLRCAPDNICKEEDDWAEIKDKMLQADAILFGPPYTTYHQRPGPCIPGARARSASGTKPDSPSPGNPTPYSPWERRSPTPPRTLSNQYSRATTWPPPSEPSELEASPNATHVATARAAPLEQSSHATDSSRRSKATTSREYT